MSRVGASALLLSLVSVACVGAPGRAIAAPEPPPTTTRANANANANANAGEDEAKEQPPPFAEWGAELLEGIERDLAVGALYAEWGRADGKRGNEQGRVAYVWPASFQLRALAAAARVEPRRYGKRLVQYATAMRAYRTKTRGVAGFAVMPGASERYYDDNAWVFLGMLDAFEVTKKRAFLEFAVEIFGMMEAGEKRTPGGGIRQHEEKDGGPFTCTIAPAALGAARLYQLTKKKVFLEAALRWRAVLRDEEIGLRDPGDGLYYEWAELRAGGEWYVQRGKRAYQSALPLRLELKLYEVTEKEEHLEEARKIAAACLERFFRDADGGGAMHETGQWGGSDLVDGFVELHKIEEGADPRWLGAAERALVFLHDKGRDEKGRYGEEWGEERTGTTLGEFKLLYMAPVARAFWRMAEVQAAAEESRRRGGRR